jgi:hypothetical protein
MTMKQYVRHFENVVLDEPAKSSKRYTLFRHVASPPTRRIDALLTLLQCAKAVLCEVILMSVFGALESGRKKQVSPNLIIAFPNEEKQDTGSLSSSCTY